jgi:hypothetical protein
MNLPTKVLDLYDVLPERTEARPAETEDDPLTSMIKNTGRNFAAIMGMFAVSLAAFIACTALFSLGLGLLVVVVGLFILVGCLIVGRLVLADDHGVALLCRDQPSALLTIPLPDRVFAASCGGWRTRKSWRDLLHVLINFILSVITFSLAMTWVFGGLGGVTYWFWSRWLPENDRGLPDLLGYPGRFADVTFHTVLGSRAAADYSVAAARTRAVARCRGVRLAGRRNASFTAAGERADSKPDRRPAKRKCIPCAGSSVTSMMVRSSGW